MSVASTYLRWRSNRDTPMVAIMVYTHAAVKLRRYASRLCAGLGDGALWAPFAMASHAGLSAAWHAAMSPAWAQRLVITMFNIIDHISIDYSAIRD